MNMNMNRKGSLIIEESFETLYEVFGFENDANFKTWRTDPFLFVEEISKKHPAAKELWELSKQGLKTLNKSCLTLIDSQGLSTEILEDYLIALNSITTKKHNGVTKH